MKTTKLIIAILFISTIAFSQPIKILGDGDVRIGNNLRVNSIIGNGSTPDFNSNVDFSYTVIFKPIFTSATLIIDGSVGQYGPQAVLYPSINNLNQLGKSNKAFSKIYCYSYYDLNSDLKQKENIRELDNALDIVTNLRGIRYDLKQSVAYLKDSIKDQKIIDKLEKERKNKIGFIGQEMINYLPEAVEYDDSTDVYAIDYTRVIPVLVEALKEQQEEIEELRSLIGEPKLKSTGEIEISCSSMLYQNIPNPFNEETTISYYIDDEIQNASLYIYDLQGKQIKSVNIIERGEAQTIINGYELSAGIYYYSLIIDNIIIDTKQMVLTN